MEFTRFFKKIRREMEDCVGLNINLAMNEIERIRVSKVAFVQNMYENRVIGIDKRFDIIKRIYKIEDEVLKELFELKEIEDCLAN